MLNQRVHPGDPEVRQCSAPRSLEDGFGEQSLVFGLRSWTIEVAVNNNTDGCHSDVLDKIPATPRVSGRGQ